MLCNMGTRTTFSAIFSLRVFESVSKTCNMLPQQIVALKIVRALCYTVSTFSATIVPCNIIFRLQAVFIKWFGMVSSDLVRALCAVTLVTSGKLDLPSECTDVLKTRHLDRCIISDSGRGRSIWGRKTGQLNTV